MNGRPDPTIRFERYRVKMLARSLGLENSLGVVWGEHRKRRGTPELTFTGFHKCFPTFPWRLASQMWYIPASTEFQGVTLKYWFEHMPQTLAWKAYRDLLGGHECRNDKTIPFGLVFSFQRIKGGLILHNAEPQSDSYFAFRQPHEDGTERQYVIERYRAWLDAIAKQGWTPKRPSRLPSRPTDRPLRVGGGAIVRPWMVALLGIGPDTLVLAWLCRVLFTKATSYRRAFLERQDGELCVHATHDQIAKEVGLSSRQVRSGLQCLRKMAIVETEGCRIRLDLDALVAARRKLRSSTAQFSKR